METLNAEDGENSLISGEELEEYETDDEGEGKEEYWEGLLDWEGK